MLFNLDFANKTISSCFFCFFLIVDSYFLIPAAIKQFFSLIAGLVIPIEIPNEEAKAEIEIHPVTAEAKIRKCSIQCRVVQAFLCFLLISLFYCISSRK